MRVWALIAFLGMIPGMARTEETKEDLERLRAEVQRLQDQLKQRETQYEELRKRTQDLASQFSKLSKELESLRAPASKLAPASSETIRPAATVPDERRGVIRQYQSEVGILSLSLPGDVPVRVGQVYDVLATKPSQRSLGRIRIGAIQPGQVLARFLGDAPADTDVRGGMEVFLVPLGSRD
jgi:hypothetical protein